MVRLQVKLAVIMELVDRVCQVFDLRKHMHFRSEVARCEWEEASHKWKVSIKSLDENGYSTVSTESCDVLLHATGAFNKTKFPKLKGLNKFRGKVVNEN